MHEPVHEEDLLLVALGEPGAREAVVRDRLSSCEGCALYAAELAADVHALCEGLGLPAANADAVLARLSELLDPELADSALPDRAIPDPERLDGDGASTERAASAEPSVIALEPRRRFRARLGLGLSGALAAAALLALAVWPSNESPGVKGASAAAPAVVLTVVEAASVAEGDLRAALDAVSEPLRGCAPTSAMEAVEVEVELRVTAEGLLDDVTSRTREGSLDVGAAEALAVCVRRALERTSLPPPEAAGRARLVLSLRPPTPPEDAAR